MRRIVLWDIDHTLIDTRGVGRELSAAAFERVTGRRMERQAKIDGITEPVIFRETAGLHGIDSSRSDFERFAEALAEAHVQRAAELRERGHALPGAAAALSALAAVDGIVQTVVSGNVRAVAEIKLAVFGLDRHIRWELGAYGEDADERPDLVRIALERAGLEAEQAVLFDDTPAGVEAGVASGVRVIAVATGRSSEGELRAAGAGAALPDLTNTRRLVELVAGV
ncbi:HAD family hydrolase [Streptomyces albireticuli]|uniref:Phosphoglycolate phosphatase n=1 Tax=Streptomyces albireticuli TaxID=1940 RepID=A0A2A2D3R9_9ACTN|nr:HAD hydrolase-like protein [Streptomyces albireticuli]MCD9196094.1 haloacid dehalogenase-like hydrolase [Streptomyces albireticuli]PAU46155.1 phosphoglycolate phosphatase [Streptomyces albireticuli]